MSKDRFALVYEAEFAVLRNLSSNAVKVFIWFKMGGARKRAAGCRQVAADAGLSRDQTARAMRELCAAGLVKLAEKGAFAAKRKVSEYEIPTQKASVEAKPQSHQCDGNRRYSRTSATLIIPFGLCPQGKKPEGLIKINPAYAA